MPRASDASTEREVALRDAVEQLTLEFPGYGYRRVTHALCRAGLGESITSVSCG